jgi:peptide deformylase
LSLLDIVKYPDDFLSKPTRPVENIDGKFQQFIDDMAETMYSASGIGLAAIQVGNSRSFIVYDVQQQDEGRNLQVLVNPRIIDMEGQIVSENEGCLSVPDYRSDVKRAEKVFVEGYDREGNPKRIEAEGLLAILLQHEIDHLEGRLFIDRISLLKRELYKKRIQKKLKSS